MKFSGEIDIVFPFTLMCIVTMEIKLICLYGNISAIYCQIYYLFYCQLKAIQSIFMNFFRDMGMDIFYSRK